MYEILITQTLNTFGRQFGEIAISAGYLVICNDKIIQGASGNESSREIHRDRQNTRQKDFSR